jgi:hypothetical protein
MFRPTYALRLLHSFFGDPKVASYKAPHAYRSNPRRPKHNRRDDLGLYNPVHGGPVGARRLFKGHRP